jgi:putative Mg2+ transporter-C (MgtC) family protein
MLLSSSVTFAPLFPERAFTKATFRNATLTRVLRATPAAGSAPFSSAARCCTRSEGSAGERCPDWGGDLFSAVGMDDSSTFVAAWRSWTPETIIALRLGLACLLGALIGLERELGHHDAGLRTHILVSVAACVFTLVAWELYQHIRDIEQPATGDPIRIIEAVTAGAGFLAAGIIFQQGARVRGLTTGAGVWTAAAIGVACGAGAYAIAGITTAIVLAVLFGLGLIERKLGWNEPDLPADHKKKPKA